MRLLSASSTLGLAVGVMLLAMGGLAQTDGLYPGGPGYGQPSSVTGVLETLGTDSATGQPVLTVRASAWRTERITVPTGDVAAEVSLVVQPLVRIGQDPQTGDIVRATGAAVKGVLEATVVEVRTGLPCARCRAFGDAAEGYRLWLVRTYFDLWGGARQERRLYRATAELLAKHAARGEPPCKLWLRGQTADLLSDYLGVRHDAIFSQMGGYAFRDAAPRVRDMLAEHKTEKILMLAQPSVPLDWGHVPIGDTWMCFPETIYVTGPELRRVY